MPVFRKWDKWWQALILLVVGVATAYPSLNKTGHCAWGGDCPYPALYFVGDVFGVAAVISGIIGLFVAGLKAAIAAIRAARD